MARRELVYPARMRKVFILLVLAGLAGACGKKQPANAPKSPTNTTDPKATDGAAPAPDMKEPAKANVGADPCEGGEMKKK